MSDRVITHRILNIEIVWDKFRMDVDLTPWLIESSHAMTWADVSTSELKLNVRNDLPLVIEQLRKMTVRAMHIAIEIHGLYFEKVPRARAYIEEPGLMLLNPNIEYFTKERPWSGTYHFQSLAEFEAWVRQQPTA